jgi:hypothetical protein
MICNESSHPENVTAEKGTRLLDLGRQRKIRSKICTILHFQELVHGLHSTGSDRPQNVDCWANLLWQNKLGRKR